MDKINPPESYVKELETALVEIIGPPPGVSREHCVDAKVLITQDWVEDGMGLGWVSFFKPTEEEVKSLVLGASIKLTLRGSGLVPHAIGLWND